MLFQNHKRPWAKGDILSEDAWSELNAQQRLEAVIGKFRDFHGFCMKSMIGVMKKSRPDFSDNSPEFKKIFNAFVDAVESYCARSMGPGGTFIHLPQHGIITQEEFYILLAEAAHLAGTMFDYIEYHHEAQRCHAECSRMLAKARGTEDYLLEHLNVM